MHSFARALGLPGKAVTIFGGATRRRVLDLHAAALVAVLGEASTEVVRIDFRTVLEELLRHEQHFWYDSAQYPGLHWPGRDVAAGAPPDRRGLVPARRGYGTRGPHFAWTGTGAGAVGADR